MHPLLGLPTIMLDVPITTEAELGEGRMLPDERKQRHGMSACGT
jgi:hypothetical protein